MTICLLVRHGQSEANVDGTLAGHLDVPLTDAGTEQARRVGASLSQVPLARVVTSPLGRCRSTANEICSLQPSPCEPTVDEAFAEVRYGAWTGGRLEELAKEDLWSTIQRTPSKVAFPADPGGKHPHESMSAMAQRVCAGWEAWERRVARQHGEKAVWAVVSHGDVIKALLARALGLELDAFQSIVVDPGSVSLVHRHQDRTAVLGMNLREDTYERLARPEPATGTEDPQSGPDTDRVRSVGVLGGGDA